MTLGEVVRWGGTWEKEGVRQAASPDLRLLLTLPGGRTSSPTLEVEVEGGSTTLEEVAVEEEEAEEVEGRSCTSTVAPRCSRPAGRRGGAEGEMLVAMDRPHSNPLLTPHNFPFHSHNIICSLQP